MLSLKQLRSKSRMITILRRKKLMMQMLRTIRELQEEIKQPRKKN